jgi:cyclic dehypoxanthinyl futalosine synthase
MDSIKLKIDSGLPITRADAATLYLEADDALLANLATQVRGRYHKHNEATYLIMAIVNYTNVCVAKCDYCSFFRLPHDKEGYLLSTEEV